MKTHKEEAEALVENFYDNCTDYIDSNKDAKECAITTSIIAVKAILDAIDWNEYEIPNKEIYHWQQVLNHLEQM